MTSHSFSTGFQIRQHEVAARSADRQPRSAYGKPQCADPRSQFVLAPQIAAWQIPNADYTVISSGSEQLPMFRDGHCGAFSTVNDAYYLPLLARVPNGSRTAIENNGNQVSALSYGDLADFRLGKLSCRKLISP